METSPLQDQESELHVFDVPFRSLDAYLQALSRRTDGGRLKDFIGQSSQDWFKFGQSGGLNTVPLEQRKQMADAFFESARGDAKQSHEMAKTAAETFLSSKDARRDLELKALEKTLSVAEQDADRSQPDSTINRHLQALHEYQVRLRTLEVVAQSWTSEDRAIADDLRKAAEGAAARAAQEASRHREIQLLRDQYSKKLEAALDAINVSQAKLLEMDPLDPLFQRAKQSHEERTKVLQQQITGEPERQALQALTDLTAALDVGATVQSADASPRAVMPKWWRMENRSYRWFLWLSLWVAVIGDQLVMNQLTGSFLQLKTLPDILDRLSSQLRTPDGADWVTLGNLGLQAIFAFFFGLLPLLLSVPVRDYLDRCEDRGRKPSGWFSAVFMTAVGVFLGAIGYAAYANALQKRAQLQLGTFGGGETDIAQAFALPAITLVLLISAGWIAHVLFSGRARRDYAQSLQRDAKDLRLRIDQVEDDISRCNGRVRAAREALVTARKRHGDEDAFGKAIQSAGAATVFDTVFDKAKGAAVAALTAGYEHGVRIRKQGLVVTEDSPDLRSFEETLERVEQFRLLADEFESKGI